ATGELRERVRDRLTRVERGLNQALSGAAGGAGAPVVGLVIEGSEEQVRARHRNLARAVADFDAATIATTHGFCQEVLGGLGGSGDVEPDRRFLQDHTGLLRRD